MSSLPHLLRKHESALLKTASYYVVHVVVAASVAYAVTGQVWVSLLLSLLEPSVQAVAYFVHEQAWARTTLRRWRTLAKTGTYYGVHLLVAALVAYAVTGDLVTALTLSLLEPTVQMVFFFVHEWLWQRRTQRQQAAAKVAPPQADGARVTGWKVAYTAHTGHRVDTTPPAASHNAAAVQRWMPVVCAAPQGCLHPMPCHAVCLR